MNMVDPEPATWADVREAARRNIGWSTIITVLWIVVWGAALKQLSSPDLAVSTRVLWCLLPVPFIAAEVWHMMRKVARSTEMERRVSEQAAGYAFALTIAFYMLLGLVNIAFPISPENWAWSWMYPFLTYHVCWTRLYRRYVPK